MTKITPVIGCICRLQRVPCAWTTVGRHITLEGMCLEKSRHRMVLMLGVKNLVLKFLCSIPRVFDLLVWRNWRDWRKICVTNKLPGKKVWNREMRLEAERLLGGKI